MKIYNNRLKRHEFRCDRCNELISRDDNEQKALQEAREVIRLGGGEWQHPHWVIICPNCMMRR